MTPHQRAAALVQEANGRMYLTAQNRAELYALAVAACREALVEAAGVCTFIPDRDRITDLLLGEPVESVNGAWPRTVDILGSTVVDHGPPPGPDHPGRLAFKPCGCAVDWLADTPPTSSTLTAADWLAISHQRLALWRTQGYRIEEGWRWSKAAPLITAALTEGCAAHGGIREVQP